MSGNYLHEALRNLFLSDNDLLDPESLISIVGAGIFNHEDFVSTHNPKIELDETFFAPRITYISSANAMNLDKRERTLLVNLYDPLYDKCELLLDRCVHLLSQPEKRFGANSANLQSSRINVGSVTFDGSDPFFSDTHELWRVTGAFTVKYVQK